MMNVKTDRQLDGRVDPLCCCRRRPSSRGRFGLRWCHCLVRRLGGKGIGTGVVRNGGGLSRPSRVLLLTTVLLTCWQASDSELVFHRRDHRDQGRYQNSNHLRSHGVQNYGEAVHYLQKYGYLENCKRAFGRSRRHLPEILSGASEQVPDCSDEMIIEALKSLQQKFDLAPSGRFDNETRMLMSKGRCGNSDISEEEEEEEKTRRRRDVDQRQSNYRAPAAAERWRNGAQTSLKTLLRDRTKRSLTEDTVLDLNLHKPGYHGQLEPEEGSSVFTETADNSQTTLTTLSTPQEYDSVAGLRKRYQMLQEITQRFQHEIASLPQHQQQKNLTAEEMTLLLKMRQKHQPQLIPKRKRRRRKRTISISLHEMSEGSTGDKASFKKDENSPVQWRLLNNGISGKIPLTDQRAILELSFRMWSEVIPLKFIEANDIAISDVDVVIAFAKQNHMNCDKPFDGIGGELAHSWKGGDIHFDEDENYKRIDPSGSGIDLLKVAVHEVGHVLGLLHNDDSNSIMYPIYPNDKYDDFELSRDDRKAVQTIYGVCKGKFDVIFDWLRKVRSSHDPNSRPRYIFNTYFFRSNRYWMYENRFNRTRFGDPLYISHGWTGIPRTVDAYTQVITSTGHEYTIDTYFFVGDSYYKYNDETDQVVEGYPRKISEDFVAKADGNESIPNNLDAVLFDNRDSMLYFFKGDWVWTYDPKLIGQNGCCEGKRLFTEVFPTAAGGDRLTGDLDTVFYSYHFQTIFFFKGEVVYSNSAYNEKSPGVNQLRHLGFWYHIWYDICDVE